VKEWEVEKILNKRKIRKVVKYLMQWKVFIAEHDTFRRIMSYNMFNTY